MDSPMKTTAKHAVLWASTVIALLALTLTVVFKFGPSIESKYFPVVTDIKGSIVKEKTDSMVVLVTGLKVRPCTTLAMHASVFTAGRWIDGPIRFINEDGSNLSIEQGRITAGSHFVRLNEIRPAGDMVKISMESQCHPFWVTSNEVITVKKQLLTPGGSEARTLPQ